jgi:transcriptional regulator with XRE-family HTH domain
MNLGDKIHQLRKQSGMSQEELASQLTISRQAISKWELGESIPDTENVLQISKLFNVTTDYLLNDNYESTHDTLISETTKNAVSSDNENTIKRETKNKLQKSPVLLDIIFLLVTIFAVGSILQIPTLIGYSTLGFLTIALQVAAVLYVPIYLFVIRPRRTKQQKAKTLIGRDAVFNRFFWGAGATGALLVCFLLCGYIFRVLHNNTDWPNLMLLLGLIVIFIAAFTSAKKVMVCTVAGYVVSFIAGLVFNYEYDVIVDGVVQSQNYTAWIIWTISFIALITAGIIWEIAGNRCIQDR